MYNTRYYTLRQKVMEKYNKILSKMCKDLVQQIVHQKIANKNCTITICTFDKAICIYQVIGMSLLIA